MDKISIPKPLPIAKNLTQEEQKEIFKKGRTVIIRPDIREIDPTISWFQETMQGKKIEISLITTVGAIYSWSNDLNGYGKEKSKDLIIRDTNNGYWYYKLLYHPDIYKSDKKLKEINILMWLSVPSKNKDNIWYTEAIDDNGKVIYKITYYDLEGLSFLEDIRTNVKYQIPDLPDAVTNYVSRTKAYNLADKLNNLYFKLKNYKTT